MLGQIFAISSGAIVGALMRFFLSAHFNTFFKNVALGTLISNYLGAYLIGVAFALPLTLKWQLFLMTGFLGALTTFSTFSLEITNLLEKKNYMMAFNVVGLHVLGSIVLTFLGIGSVIFLKRFF